MIEPRFLGRTLFAVGLIVLAIANLAIAIQLGTPRLWDLPVHEDGVRTFGDTVLYYEHAVRELPVDLVLALAIGGGAAYALPAMEPDGTHARKTFSRLLLLSLLVVAVIIGGAWATVGGPAVVENLLQYPTRPGEPGRFGAHWRYHLLERLSLIVICTGFSGLLRSLIGPRNATDGTSGGIILFASLVLFLGLSGVFAGGPAELGAVFTDPLHLGHQAREVLTHGLVTLPLAWGVCLMAAAKVARPNPLEIHPGALVGAGAWVVFGAMICLYLGVAAVAADAASHGQSGDMATLVFPHFFEHSFTYLVVPLAAATVYQACAWARA